jgi:uncharacterized protein DUF4145
MSNETEKLKIQCLTCLQKTNHEILQEIAYEDSAPEENITWWSKFQIVQCKGCETVSFRKASGSSEDYDFETGEALVKEELYPSRTAGKRLIEGYEQFPTKTFLMYREVVQALNNDAPILAAIGLRALIESICIEQGTTSSNLMDSIDELANMGLLSQHQAQFLHTHRFMGNIAAHEMKAPRPRELDAAFDIAETLLKTIYILPSIVASIHTGKNQISAP